MADERGSGSGSLRGQIIAGIVVALLVGGSAPWWWTELFGDGSTADGPEPGPGPEVCEDPAIALSQGSGPSGTELVVRGSGFPADESVEIRFHTEALPPGRSTSEGAFEVLVRVPGTFDAFAPMQFEIRAITTPTVCSGSAPFRLTE